MIIYGRDDEVARWYAERLGKSFIPHHMAIGLVDRDGYLVGAVFKTVENKFTSSATIYSEAYSLAPFAKGVFNWLFDGAVIAFRSDPTKNRKSSAAITSAWVSSSSASAVITTAPAWMPFNTS